MTGTPVRGRAPTQVASERRSRIHAELGLGSGLHVDDENTTLVTASSWTYLSSGYRPGEELLTVQVRHDITHTQRAKQEGLLSA